RPAQERDRKAQRPRAPSAARYGDDRLNHWRSEHSLTVCEMFIGRFLMRLLLVPLGGCVAICVGMLFAMVAHWNRVAGLITDDYSGLTAFLTLIPMLAVGSGVMLLPALLGAMIAEAFAIRSWMYHVANGGLSAAVSPASIGGF